MLRKCNINFEKYINLGIKDINEQICQEKKKMEKTEDRII